MRRAQILLALMLCLPPGSAAVAESSTPPAVINITGYNDMDEMLVALTRHYAARHPGVSFSLELKSTRSAPPALLAGTTSLAPMGAEMSSAERAAIRSRWGHEPVAIRVAHDSLAPNALSSPTGVFVHHSNRLKSIRMATLRRIFAPSAHGITDWSTLGERQRPIRLIGLADTTAIGRFLLDAVLKRERFAAGYRGFAQSREAASAIASDPDAIGFANLNHKQPKIRALDIIDDKGRRARPVASDIVDGRYPLDRVLLIYSRRGADGRVPQPERDFLAFVLSPVGQRIIASGSRGYLPLNPHERRREQLKIDNLLK